VNVLDYDASTRLLRSRSWLSIYSPDSMRYRLALEPNGFEAFASQREEKPAVRMSWFGIPESSFGGMYREGGQSISPPAYRFLNRAKGIDNLPIPIWGAKALSGEWCAQGEDLIESHLESLRPGQLRGTIRHHFPAKITDWFLAYDTRVFLPHASLSNGEVDAFPPNSDWPRNDPNWDRIRQREIGGYLTRAFARRAKQDQGGAQVESIGRGQVPYAPLAEGHQDPLGEIVRVLSFHQLVGGKQYTGMENHALRDMELSGRLGLNRAVLFGRLDVASSKLKIEDHVPAENQNATFIRIVLPVEINHANAQTPLKFKAQ
jgi:hypothetical protein